MKYNILSPMGRNNVYIGTVNLELSNPSPRAISGF